MAQKAEITAHSVPQNENLGKNWNFLPTKAIQNKKKLQHDGIGYAGSNGDVCGYVAISILILNLYSVHSAPQTANLNVKTENSAIFGHKEAQIL